MKAAELTFNFIVSPLDDCIDSPHPVLQKWQVKESLLGFMNDYIDKIMTEDDYAQIAIGGREGTVTKQ